MGEPIGQRQRQSAVRQKTLEDTIYVKALSDDVEPTTSGLAILGYVGPKVENVIQKLGQLHSLRAAAKALGADHFFSRVGLA